MEIPYFRVSSFTDDVFAGNPAGVCLLDDFPDDEVMQDIARENALSETAFVVEGDDGLHLRWFTPAVEVDLCGHATLAAARIWFDERNPDSDTLVFHTRSGFISVTENDELLAMDFPARYADPADPPGGLLAALGVPVAREIRRSVDDYLVVLDEAIQLSGLAPNMARLAKVDCRGVIVTAPGHAPNVDFVSRFFAPRVGVPEDPVTGSAHCTLAPYWAERLGRDELRAAQISARGGEVFCVHRGERVTLAGYTAVYSAGTIYL